MAENLPETVSLFRAVTAAEREDILQTKGFRVKFGGMESKQFATTLAGAQFFGEAVVSYYDEPAYFMVEVVVSRASVRFYRLVYADGRLVYTIHKDRLKRFNGSIQKMIWHEQS